MKLRFLCGVVTVLLFFTSRSYGYELPVIDAQNLIVNTTTSVNTTFIAEETYWMRVALQDIAEMERLNLLHGNGPYDDILALLKKLDGALQEGEAITYLMQVKQLLKKRYPGYVNPRVDWIPQYELGMNTMLSTQRGTLGTVQKQFELPERLREIAITLKLKEGVENAIGNMDISQQMARIMLQDVEEGRKLRQIIGATMNAQNVALTNQTALEAAGQKVFDDWILESQIAVVPFSGQGGFGPGSFSALGR